MSKIEGFDWDAAKARANYRRHGITFETAARIFDDAFAIEHLDDRADYGEQRFNIIGTVDGRVLVVAYTMRGDITRIISARGADPYERRRYHEESS